jgi:hemerythrin-like domain-containing protein
MDMDESRRSILTSGLGLGAVLLLGAACDEAGRSSSGKAKDEPEVTATEDLMREHGILRRALTIYREAADQLRTNPASVNLGALNRTAKLFRAFGEDYHERKLEEAYIFPALKKSGGKNAALSDVLLAQHQRGREVTDYILAATSAAQVGSNAQVIADVLARFARMYEPHTAREDTEIFPAWKKTMNEKELDEIGDKFETIEHETFGKDGFDDALEQIQDIERTLNVSDPAMFTAPPPPSG